MCTSLTEAVHKAGNQAVTLEQLIRLESTCTGTDYQHKLALRCNRLAQGIGC
ncbi:hypothetical protein CSC43_6965 [Pseudomonas aeruginosa]|nr:Hypothetical protein [Pseudomonas aeruginosa]AVK09527.1 hypothetical protein CSB93_6800 [Pseudomonas paraeruginosa]AWE95528.1 hypothetical protein CSC28_6636 [Pseudomonas paraeruginosa]AWE96373.1 hypothetical protein CSC26_7324 [Pseudomonas aeruginosa]RCH25283.1 hypothetical protein CSC43_6965 [Pseudomonas aeruginosa]